MTHSELDEVLAKYFEPDPVFQYNRMSVGGFWDRHATDGKEKLPRAFSADPTACRHLIEAARRRGVEFENNSSSHPSSFALTAKFAGNTEKAGSGVSDWPLVTCFAIGRALGLAVPANSSDEACEMYCRCTKTKEPRPNDLLFGPLPPSDAEIKAKVEALTKTCEAELDKNAPDFRKLVYGDFSDAPSVSYPGPIRTGTQLADQQAAFDAEFRRETQRHTKEAQEQWAAYDALVRGTRNQVAKGKEKPSTSGQSSLSPSASSSRSTSSPLVSTVSSQVKRRKPVAKLAIAAFLGYLASQVSVDPAVITSLAAAFRDLGAVGPETVNSLTIGGAVVASISLIMRAINKSTAARVEVARIEKK